MRIDKEEAEKNRETGFSTIWGVSEDYEVKDGILISKGKTTFYPPMIHRELPNVIYKLNPNNHDDLLKFARAYGKFGIANLIKPEERQGGDPIHWMKAHIEGIRAVLNLLEAIQNESEKECTRIIETTITPWGDRGKIQHNLFIGNVNGHGLKSAKDIVRNIIKRNIEMIHREPDRGENDSIVSYFHFKALIEVVYWQILDAAEGGEFRRCKLCGSPFIAQDGRQKFCPPKHFETNSRCADLYRQRKRRQKQKGDK